MSLVVLGLAGELRAKGIAVNALWPRTTIATAAINNLLGGERVMRMSRTPDIMADAAYRIFHKPSRSNPGAHMVPRRYHPFASVVEPKFRSPTFSGYLHL
jgi:citronellol/citronellal dehydrogenase